MKLKLFNFDLHIQSIQRQRYIKINVCYLLFFKCMQHQFRLVYETWRIVVDK